MIETAVRTDRRITATFAVYSEDSAHAGYDLEDGWIDQEGRTMEPDSFDKEEGITAVEKAVDFLRDEGVGEPSCVPFMVGVWYITEPVQD